MDKRGAPVSNCRPVFMNLRPLTAVVVLSVGLAIGLWAPGARAGFMPPQGQILSDMELANHHFTNEWPVPGCATCLPKNHPSNIWTRGTYFEGDLALYRLNNDPNIYNYAVAWGTFHNWALWGADSTDTASDDQCAGQDYIELYQFDPTQTNRLTHIVNNANAWVARTNLGYWSYVDTLHMSMPVFAKLSALANSSVYPAKMYSYFHYTKSVIGPSNGLYNSADHLWCRDTNFLSGYSASDGTLSKCYWSRGNGWAFAALARTMDVLSTNDAHFPEYLQTFQEMAATLTAIQRPDGFWNVNLGYPNDFPGPESSGTACFTYGLAWGIRHGYLDASTYLPAVIAGWNALANSALHHTTGADNGFLGYVQGTGSKPADHQPVTYNSQPDFDDFCTGLFLLAGSQVYQLSSTPGIILETPNLSQGQVALHFNVISSVTNATISLLQTDRLGAGWATNASATLVTNIAGLSYGFTVPNDAAERFYRVQISQ